MEVRSPVVIAPHSEADSQAHPLVALAQSFAAPEADAITSDGDPEGASPSANRLAPQPAGAAKTNRRTRSKK